MPNKNQLGDLTPHIKDAPREQQARQPKSRTRNQAGPMRLGADDWRKYPSLMGGVRKLPNGEIVE